MKNIKLMVAFALVSSMGTMILAEESMALPTNLACLKFCLAANSETQPYYNAEKPVQDIVQTIMQNHLITEISQKDAVKLYIMIKQNPLHSDVLKCIDKALQFHNAINHNGTHVHQDFWKYFPGCRKHFIATKAKIVINFI